MSKTLFQKLQDLATDRKWSVVETDTAVIVEGRRFLELDLLLMVEANGRNDGFVWFVRPKGARRIEVVFIKE